MYTQEKPDLNELTHFGILGMHWGHHNSKSDNKGLATASKKEIRDQRIASFKKGTLRDHLTVGEQHYMAKQDKKQKKEKEKAQKKWDKNFNENWYKAYNEAANYSNSVLIPAINKKYGKYDFSSLDTEDAYNPKGDPKLVKAYKRYINEYDTKFADLLQQKYDNMFGKRPE